MFVFVYVASLCNGVTNYFLLRLGQINALNGSN